jgi:hypothetical protein
MQVCTVRQSDGFMTMYEPSELSKIARKLVKVHGPKGSKLADYWVCADHRTNETRLIAQYKQPDGWQSSVGQII